MGASTVLFFFLITASAINAFPEQGKWTLNITPESPYIGITKNMFNNSEIRVKVKCTSVADPPSDIKITWILRKTPCWKEYFEYTPEEAANSFYSTLFKAPEEFYLRLDGDVQYHPAVLKPPPYDAKCDDNIILPPVDGKDMLQKASLPEAQVGEQPLPGAENVGGVRVKRDDPQPEEAHDIAKNVEPDSGGNLRTRRPLVVVNGDGIYLFMMTIESPSGDQISASVDIEMKSSLGYLSAAEYPLLVFYSILCVVYVIYGAIWLVLCFYRWRDLLRLQYWIAAVILLGLLEKAVFVAEYGSLNEKGFSVPGLLVAAEMVSCAKRTIARILVVIVALGFGIVKPRLGTLLQRVVGLGMLYFILASIESCTRVLKPRTDASKESLLAVIPLALLDSLICWWVFSALVSTTRTLRLRRNPTKLALYSHFTNCLAAAVVASIAFMIWSIKYHQFEQCLQDWKELWVDEAFWHLLFALLLLAIMILWRPTNNNQRFAFSPLLDEGSDCEENEQLMGALAQDTEHRTRTISTTSMSPRNSQTAEDDLKWVDDNIPSSIVDTNFAVLDSDEEIMTTKFEMSKMQ